MREANRIMSKLRQEGQADEETLGMLGSNYKKLEEQATDSRFKTAYSGQAIKYYRMAYERTGGYWSGINAATLLAMSGKLDDAKVLAHSIYQQCQHADTDILTIGQYLQPTRNHLPVERWVTPEQFDVFKVEGLKRGFKVVESGPMVRSSYHAEEQARQLSGSEP